ncbi:MAG: TIGR03905 family TSCPD domain-containing protein [Clostridia bacterium]
MIITHKNKGTCSRSVTVEIDEQNIIRDVSFVGGCNGNLKGVSKLVCGRDASEVVTLLEGTKCGMRNTSCPDQLAQAIKSHINS